MSTQAPIKHIKVRYFALLREERGLDLEEIDTTAHTLEQLYKELANRYRFSLEANSLAVSQDDNFAAWGDSIKDGSTIVFIPPVAGG
ncbi:MoaD/ThiS family protein [bacterium]|nr:MoaD/ThiS family protein [bacterium]